MYNKQIDEQKIKLDPAKKSPNISATQPKRSEPKDMEPSVIIPHRLITRPLILSFKSDCISA